MSGIATVLAQQGHTVTGSDQADGPAVERLREQGVDVHVGHDAAHVGDAELVVISTAVADDNPEVAAARSRGIDVLRRIDLLPALARRQPFVSVSGTHGKTTTTSMLATAMVGAGEDPSFLIGAPVPVLGGAAAARRGSLVRARGRRERRQLPGRAPRRRGGDEHRGRPPGVLGRLGRAARRLRALPGRDRRPDGRLRRRSRRGIAGPPRGRRDLWRGRRREPPDRGSVTGVRRGDVHVAHTVGCHRGRRGRAGVAQRARTPLARSQCSTCSAWT